MPSERASQAMFTLSIDGKTGSMKSKKKTARWLDD
jgi:hypothetical protein